MDTMGAVRFFECVSEKGAGGSCSRLRGKLSKSIYPVV